MSNNKFPFSNVTVQPGVFNMHMLATYMYVDICMVCTKVVLCDESSKALLAHCLTKSVHVGLFASWIQWVRNREYCNWKMIYVCCFL